jgi:hypothetical protein
VLLKLLSTVGAPGVPATLPSENQPLGMALAQALPPRALSSKLALLTGIAAPFAKPGAKIATQRAERILSFLRFIMLFCGRAVECKKPNIACEEYDTNPSLSLK